MGKRAIPVAFGTLACRHAPEKHRRSPGEITGRSSEAQGKHAVNSAGQLVPAGLAMVAVTYGLVGTVSRLAA
jgi:hypothetical protein